MRREGILTTNTQICTVVACANVNTVALGDSTAILFDVVAVAILSE